jgi:hypothetical protein
VRWHRGGHKCGQVRRHAAAHVLHSGRAAHPRDRVAAVGER